MAKSKQELIEQLSANVLDMEDDEVARLAQEYLDAGYPAIDAIMEGLVDGMNKAGELFDEEEYFVADLLMCSDAMYAGLDILQPHLPQSAEGDAKPTVVIGVIAGDTHDIGKNLVKIMLDTAGFDVHDLGTNVAAERFVDEAVKTDARVICVSALLTTTMPGMADVVRELEGRKLHGKIKVMIGGGPVTESFARKIGADGYSENAVQAVDLAKRLESEATAQQ